MTIYLNFYKYKEIFKIIGAYVSYNTGAKENTLIEWSPKVCGLLKSLCLFLAYLCE